jgi:hypothetical protein
MAVFFVLAFLALIEKVAGTLQKLLLPLAHLDGMHTMVRGDLLKGLAATDGFHGHLGLELRAVGSSFAHRWDAPGGGDAASQRLTMGPVQKTRLPQPDQPSCESVDWGGGASIDRGPDHSRGLLALV